MMDVDGVFRNPGHLVAGFEPRREGAFLAYLTAAEAEEFGADLIAVTTSSHKTLKSRLMGSVALDLMKRAKMPVLLLRPAFGA